MTADGIREDPLRHCVLHALVLGLLPHLDMGLPRHNLLDACADEDYDIHFGDCNELLKRVRVPWRLVRKGDAGEDYTAAEIRAKFGPGLILPVALVLTLIVAVTLTQSSS